MNKTVLEPEYFIYVNERNSPQYPAFLKMIKADADEYHAFLKMIETDPSLQSIEDDAFIKLIITEQFKNFK
jgi:hypothetical protein